MTLFFILIILSIVFLIMTDSTDFFPPIFILGILFLAYSMLMSNKFYLEEETKKIEIQNFILKDGTQAFILYKIEDDPEEKTGTISLNIADGSDSFIEIKKPKPSEWYFINFAFENQKIYIGREELKKMLDKKAELY